MEYISKCIDGVEMDGITINENICCKLCYRNADCDIIEDKCNSICRFDIMDNIKEYSILKNLTELNSKRNAIIETRDGEQFACNIEINGIKYFSNNNNKKENPINIERITFLINGKDYEFVACQD